MPIREDFKKVLIIGSGPIRIGQACEFDYSGTQACKALREMGYTIVLANSNPATIMTDANMADSTYIVPLNVKNLEEIIIKERPKRESSVTTIKSSSFTISNSFPNFRFSGFFVPEIVSETHCTLRNRLTRQ